MFLEMSPCVENESHFGTLFFARSAPWVPLGGSVSPKRGFGGGSKTGPKTGPKKDVDMEPFRDPFLDLFRDLFANLPFLLKTHGACTRALILRAGVLKIHHFWAPFSAPFLVPFWIPKMGPKWVPKWDPTKTGKSHLRDVGPHLGRPRSRKRVFQKWSQKWTFEKSDF